MSRPEHLAPPQLFYNDAEARKYTTSSRIQSIQSEMASRCIELLNLPQSDDGSYEPSLILDIGCGSGLSGEILSEHGHEWIGVDISGSMLEVALDREVEGDLCLHDIGQGFGFRAGSLDGAISVSVIQWLCNADNTSHSPPHRLKTFFETLFASLKRGARAAFQFYPESDDQVRMIMSSATKAGFGGGLVVDYPNSQKAKKIYLALMTGQNEAPALLPVGRESDPQQTGRVSYAGSKKHHSSGRNKSSQLDVTKKAWVQQKKALYRSRGKGDVPLDSAYTGRKRRVRF